MPDLSLNSPERSVLKGSRDGYFRPTRWNAAAWTIRLIVLDISHRSPAQQWLQFATNVSRRRVIFWISLAYYAACDIAPLGWLWSFSLLPRPLHQNAMHPYKVENPRTDQDMRNGYADQCPVPGIKPTPKKSWQESH